MGEPKIPSPTRAESTWTVWGNAFQNKVKVQKCRPPQTQMKGSHIYTGSLTGSNSTGSVGSMQCFQFLPHAFHASGGVENNRHVLLPGRRHAPHQAHEPHLQRRGCRVALCAPPLQTPPRRLHKREGVERARRRAALRIADGLS